MKDACGICAPFGSSEEEPTVLVSSPKINVVETLSAGGTKHLAVILEKDDEGKISTDDDDGVHVLLKPDRKEQGKQEIGSKPGIVIVEKELHRELDFDVNPSELYLLLQRRDWPGAKLHLASYPEEATYWISRREPDGKLRWRLLPLHGAIIFSAPEATVRLLLEAYPESVAAKDDQGMLPLHLSYRMGSIPGIVELLLNAFPESIEVKDRKGRTPVAMAQNSKGPNRNAFLKAVEKATTPKAGKQAKPEIKIEFEKAQLASPTKPGITVDTPASAPDRFFSQQHDCVSPASAPGPIHGYHMKDVRKEHRIEIAMLKHEGHVQHVEHEKTIARMTAELALNEETSQISKEKVAELEKKLKQEEETQTALATKIASLDVGYKATLKEMKTMETALTSEIDELRKEKEALKEKLIHSEAENKTLHKSLVETRTKADKVYSALENHTTDKSQKYESLMKDYMGACSNVSILEDQLKKRILHEQRLVQQVSSLARQLSVATQDNEKAMDMFTTRVHALTQEREDLRITVSHLSKKLFQVAAFLESMETEQEKIVDKVDAHNREMTEASDSHTNILAVVRVHQQALETLKYERDMVVEKLRRQDELIQRTSEEQAKMVEQVQQNALKMSQYGELRKELVKDAANLAADIASALRAATCDLPRQDTDDEDKLVNEVLRTVLSVKYEGLDEEHDYLVQDKRIAVAIHEQERKDDIELENIETIVASI